MDYFRNQGIELYRSDSRFILPFIGTSDLMLTSPPYLNQRHYGGQTIHDWHELMCEVFTAFRESHNCQVLVNLGMAHRHSEVVPYWNEFISNMCDNKWKLFGWYVWDKTFGMPNGNGRLNASHEFIFHFCRKTITPNRWVPCRNAGGWSTHSQRMPDLTLLKQKKRRRIPATKVPDTVFRVNPFESSRNTGHPAVFPVRFAEELLLTYTQPGDTVLDPFMGSGSTAIACMRHNRKFIGVELVQPYFDIAVKRVKEECYL